MIKAGLVMDKDNHDEIAVRLYGNRPLAEGWDRYFGKYLQEQFDRLNRI